MDCVINGRMEGEAIAQAPCASHLLARCCGHAPCIGRLRQGRVHGVGGETKRLILGIGSLGAQLETHWCFFLPGVG